MTLRIQPVGDAHCWFGFVDMPHEYGGHRGRCGTQRTTRMIGVTTIATAAGLDRGEDFHRWWQIRAEVLKGAERKIRRIGIAARLARTLGEATVGRAEGEHAIGQRLRSTCAINDRPRTCEAATMNEIQSGTVAKRAQPRRRGVWQRLLDGVQTFEAEHRIIKITSARAITHAAVRVPLRTDKITDEAGRVTEHFRREARDLKHFAAERHSDCHRSGVRGPGSGVSAPSTSVGHHVWRRGPGPRSPHWHRIKSPGPRTPDSGRVIPLPSLPCTSLQPVRRRSCPSSDGAGLSDCRCRGCAGCPPRVP